MKKETTRRLQLVEELYYAKDRLTSEQLMDLLQCSLPALISDIRFLNEEPLPLTITKIKGLYSIEFDVHATIDVMYAYILKTSLEFQVIESLFFEKNRGIQLAADRLNCSFSNMQRYLKSIKQKLSHWNIHVYHRPLRVTGDEVTIRHFYYLFFKESRMSFNEYGFSEELVSSIDQMIQQLLEMNQISNNMNVHSQLMHSFLIGLQRIKQGHQIQKLSSDSGLIIPSLDNLERLSKLIKRETNWDFGKAQLAECLWPLFTHQLILNTRQQSLANQMDEQLSDFYESHNVLLERLTLKLSQQITRTEIIETLRLLGNELFCYYPQGRLIEILQQNSKTMLTLVDKKYSREIRKLKEIVTNFLAEQYHPSFIDMYVSHLITTIDELLQRLVDAEEPIKILLLSDTSSTHERFWQSIFPAFIKGSIRYEYFEIASFHKMN
ncbi:hypothetical protein RV04_GL001329 [Enterococcus hermanniensis]|uniref:Mga helix-turn-helix domain-containing protein n=2 Tax=Enterococcus hermanniensis TaxID=249189 RepID=A0A1L8TPK5_9ENTE|nr:hypothetical protein RV04_GL001329 [Enterococcus hermanniensis]